MKVAIYSLGCKVNIYESEYVISLLKKNNYEIVDFTTYADIYIINTCSVTNQSDKKSRKAISLAKKNNPNAIIVVMGCYSQVKPEEIDADIVIGNKDKSKIVQLIEEYRKNNNKIKKIYNLSKVSFEDMEIDKFINHTRAFVKIQDGCNAFCSYCIIPYTRGKLRSKKLESVIDEVSKLVENGYHEIVLTGIHTGRYGIDINTNLETLLEKLLKIKGLYRLRLSSIEINEVTDKIISLIKENKIMAHHLHIPLQSGSDTILKLMNRHYNTSYFLNKINDIRKQIPDISITTDLIVGFPYETDELFLETVKFLEKIKFSHIHTFPYSKRNGTKASLMPQISSDIKKKRVHEVLAISKHYEEEFYKKNIGKIYDGVVEQKANKTVVHTTNFIPVILDNEIENNKIVKVQITQVNNLEVYGKELI